MPPFLWPFGGIAATSFYDTRPLKETLERLVDFDRINARETRLSVGAVDVETGNFAYFDNASIKIVPEHIMASGALPPGFPAVEIEGRSYWDGGLVSNTPLTEVLGQHPPRRDTIVFQVDLWSSDGRRPNYHPRRRRSARRTSAFPAAPAWRPTPRPSCSACAVRSSARSTACRPRPRSIRRLPACAIFSARKVYNVLHLIYRDKQYEAQHKDYEFSLPTMREHWEAGLADIRRTLKHPEWLERPRGLGVVTARRASCQTGRRSGWRAGAAE